MTLHIIYSSAFSCFSCSILPLFAYNFSSGPFKRLWIKLGYDPRSNPADKIYQGLDIRVPKDVTIIEAQNRYRTGGTGVTSGVYMYIPTVHTYNKTMHSTRIVRYIYMECTA